MLTGLIQSFGYLAVFVLMTLESALLPVPSEVTMPFAGYLVSQGTLNFWAVVFMGALGNLVGSLIGYYIGYLIEESVLIGWIQRYGKYVFVREADYRRGVVWFGKYGNTAVFVSRLLPAVRTFISLPAGVFRMNVWIFSLYTFVGSFIWSWLLTWIGFALGNQWGNFEASAAWLNYSVAIGVVLLGGYYIYRHSRK